MEFILNISEENFNAILNNKNMECKINVGEIRSGEGKPVWRKLKGYKNGWEIDWRKDLWEKCRSLEHKPILKKEKFDTQYGERTSYCLMCKKCGIRTCGKSNKEKCYESWEKGEVFDFEGGNE